ncbi:MAG: lipoprotein signal peptidase [Bacteroidota bacterium]
MKGRNVALIILLIVLADQAFKIYIKTHYAINDQTFLVGKWARLLFVENEGMAYGMSFGGNFGKIILTLFRFAAVIFGVWYLGNIIKKKYHRGFIFCAALIFSGALGNLIDSMFYGLIFEESTQSHVAAMFPEHGYAGFLHGKVVDMLYFPIIRDATFPNWVPFWGGQDFEFFRPIFNLADAAISSGVIAILLFQKKFFKHPIDDPKHPTVETEALENDKVQVQ